MYKHVRCALNVCALPPESNLNVLDASATGARAGRLVADLRADVGVDLQDQELHLAGWRWQALAGSGRLWQALAFSGRLWQALTGSGQLAPALGGEVFFKHQFPSLTKPLEQLP